LKLSIGVPSSKSISNRLLLLQKTSGVPINVKNLSTAEDTKLLSDLLNRIETSSFSMPTSLYCNNCGTAYRFLTAYLACTQGRWILDGNNNMQNRPVKALVDTLVNAGADIKYLRKSGFPPLQISGKQLTTTYWKINSLESSQYVSAIAMILPLLHRNSIIEFSPDTASLQYIDMTIKLMQQINLSIWRQDNIIRYVYEDRVNIPVCFFVEYDWSSAAVWFVLAALSVNANLFISGLKKSNLQGDSIIVQWMELFGLQTKYTEDGVHITKIKREIPDILQLNCKNNLDLVPYLASLCVGLKIKARLENVENLSIKESNRIDALTIELGKIATVKYKDHALIIEPNQNKFPQTVYFSSHNDHRIAMALSILSCCMNDLHIDNTECVAKSYPEYWQNFAKINKQLYQKDIQ
jgi:3-phosphoshikimate 1-carboxyvinyltransferase